MTTLQNIIEHLEIDLTNKVLHNGKKNPNKNKYYWFRNQYYIVQLSGNDNWCVMSSNEKTRELLTNHVWTKHMNGYSICSGRQFHRYALDCPEDKVIDHINRCPFDNRIDNLRICTHRENARNQSKHSTNTSGTTGVWRLDRRPQQNKVAWIGEISDMDGKARTKLFNIKRYGEEEAKRLATEWRRQKELEYGYTNG